METSAVFGRVGHGAWAGTGRPQRGVVVAHGGRAERLAGLVSQIDEVGATGGFADGREEVPDPGNAVRHFDRVAGELAIELKSDLRRLLGRMGIS